MFRFCFVSMYYILQILYRPGQITVEQRYVLHRLKFILYIVQASHKNVTFSAYVIKQVAPEVANEPILFISVTCSARTTKSYKSAFIR